MIIIMNKQKTVVIGLSGGVDSSVAALLLKRKGYSVIGVFMKNFSDTKDILTGDCTYLEDKKDAQKIASILGIPFVFVDKEKEYKKNVLKKMYNDYARGLTPNPDTLCNKIIKFPVLWNIAVKLKADYIATGHYSQIIKGKNGFELLAGKDKSKDQSYFLYELDEKTLKHTLFPLGRMNKKEVREIAKQNKFQNWNKESTSGVCFVSPRNFKEFLKKKVKGKEGRVLSPEGKIIGMHPGNVFFTIGERVGEKHGIKISNEFRNKIKDKIYIAMKKGNDLIVAPKSHELLRTKKVFIKKLHIINMEDKIKGKITARIRHLGELISGKLLKNGNQYEFVFSKGVKGIAEGQAIVLYNGEKVIGGGEIRLKV